MPQSKLEGIVEELSKPDQLRLLQEAEEYRTSFMLPMTAFSRDIMNRCFPEEGMSFTKVRMAIYRQFALINLI